jgi:hypothetical protein
MYHGTTTRAADLHQEGALLGSLSRPCVDAGASLEVVNHFNQSGSGVSLKRITMAGSGEWADSWMLLSHRVEPNVEHGVFRLAVAIGSRQWGGTTWELDLTLGRFDPDLGEHEGDIAWDIRRASAKWAKSEQAAERILALAARRPFQLTREDLATGAGGGVARNRELVDSLTAEGRLVLMQRIRHNANGRPRKTWLYGPRSDDDTTTDGLSSLLPDTPEGTGSD